MILKTMLMLDNFQPKILNSYAVKIWADNVRFSFFFHIFITITFLKINTQ